MVGLMLKDDVLWDSGILLRQTEEEMSEMCFIFKMKSKRIKK